MSLPLVKENTNEASLLVVEYFCPGSSFQLNDAQNLSWFFFCWLMMCLSITSLFWHLVKFIEVVRIWLCSSRRLRYAKFLYLTYQNLSKVHVYTSTNKPHLKVFIIIFHPLLLSRDQFAFQTGREANKSCL